MRKDNSRPIKWDLIKKRIIKHHFLIFLFSGITIALLYISFDSDDIIWRVSMATAYPALILLSVTLLTGPWKLLNRQSNPVSDDLTRDIGIWAGIVGLVHVIFGLQVHMRGKMWQLFFDQEVSLSHIRLDLFGTANHTGLVATGILIILLAISNNRSLRKLGATTWKRIQRWNYGLFLLVIIHSIIYMYIENRTLPFILSFSAMILIVLTMQVKGFIYYKRRYS